MAKTNENFREEEIEQTREGAGAGAGAIRPRYEKVEKAETFAVSKKFAINAITYSVSAPVITRAP